MHFAVIGDIMSNFSGLKAILSHLDEEGIHRIIHAGNVIGGPVGGLNCLRLLMAENVLCVQGRRDKAIIKTGRHTKKMDADEELLAAYQSLDSGGIEFLSKLPRKQLLAEEGMHILICHGSVNSPNVILDSNTPRVVFQRQREMISCPIIISGGAAEPFYTLVGDTLFVIPGAMTNAEGAVCYTRVDTEVLPPSAETVTL